MTVTKLVKMLDVKFNRKMYVSHITKPNLSGLRVYGVIYPQDISRSVGSTDEHQRVTIYYQTNDSN